MREIEALVREAASLASARQPLADAEAEAARQLQICNACRYCEGFCAVFPAMTRRLSFERADIHYLANLCHNCGACLHACQYAPPHEFAVVFPQTMAQVRARTYQDYAWPSACAALYRRAGLTTALALAGGLALFLALAVALAGPLAAQPHAGHFYSVFPHRLLAMLFGAVSLFAIVALGVGVRRFWCDISPATVAVHGERAAMTQARAPAATEALRDAARLTHLGGGHGDGCHNEDDRYSLARRRFHHLTFYGFVLCFAATCVATFYHFVLGLEAPYAITSLPVILGSLGGLGLIAGPAGLLHLHLRRHPLQGDPAQHPMDRGFIALLLLCSLSGFAVLLLRDTAAMPLTLAVHLGIVLALFITLPWGKFAHGVYRTAALFRHSIEKRLPTAQQPGRD
ncbi:MAG TPA: tricarballylate utilization 4Fe-4S protein TcuB [Burkholderiaceae bacterium]|nr:tricarballylate utilization 4Fe-4S protein TcuB [Burkholderiaceae bacterium]